MLFPRAVVASPGELPAVVFDRPAVAAGSATTGTGEGDPAAGGVSAEAADAPPRLLTYETKAFISAAFTLSETMPAAFI
jgi:hypothetical protein